MEKFLQSHEARHAEHEKGCNQVNCNYNEIVIDADYWREHLPHTIRAVFFPLGHTSAEGMTREVHEEFMRVFPEVASQTPLVSFDDHRLDAPFRLVA